MANKSVLEEIKKVVEARSRELLDTVDAELATQQNFEGSQVALVRGLRTLVVSYRDQANLVMESGARGKGAEATALRSTASTLEELASQVESLTDDAPAERSYERVVQDAGLDEAVHAFVRADEGGKCTALVIRGEDVDVCGRYVSHPAHRSAEVRDTSGLDTLIAQRSQVIPVQSGTTEVDPPVTLAAGEVAFLGFAEPSPLPPRGFYPADPPEGTQASIDLSDMHAELAADDNPIIGAEAMIAYLRGDTDVMPGDEPPAPSPLPPGPWPAHETKRGPVTDPEILKAAKVLEPAPAPVVFAAPAALGTQSAEPVMPGRRLTFAELRQGTSLPMAPHTSNSQVTQMNDCGLQYRLARLEANVIERPQWHLVGGKALHRAAEAFERIALTGASTTHVDAESLWRESFNAEIIAQMLACPQVLQDDWRASGRGGSEGYTWWLTQGADMVKRYLDVRRAEPDRVMLMDGQTGVPVLEHEGVLDVEGTPHKVVIDQAWQFGPNDIVIDDLKSGANAPRGGTFQLAQYAWYLRQRGYECKIYGRYWDARKGVYSAPVDLLELHPWDEIVWRIKDTEAKKQAGLFGPNPGPFCGGCAVKHACPVVTRG